MENRVTVFLQWRSVTLGDERKRKNRSGVYIFMKFGYRAKSCYYIWLKLFDLLSAHDWKIQIPHETKQFHFLT